MTRRTEKVARPARTELGRRLRTIGALTDNWAPAFEAVDRADFLPDVFWTHDMATRGNTAVDRATDPEAWLQAVDSDIPIVTQWDDGEHEGLEPGRVSTSSASMPSVVFRMLRDLDVRDGMRALEIGTGTGYNAALLAHRLGDDAVTTMEVDEQIAADARKALERAGAHPHVVCGDGFAGGPAGARYDRIIATCGLRRVPAAWLQQTQPGGIILVPWGTDFTTRDALAQLVVREDGSATGQFTGWVEFMKLRAQRLAWPRFEEYLPNGFPGDAAVSSTDVPPADVAPEDPFDTTAFIVGLRVAQATQTVQRDEGAITVWFISLADRSWARVSWIGLTGEVHQAGPRRLWDEVAGALQWWHGQGRPDVDRFGLTVTREAQHAWLDSPDGPSWRLPA